MVDRLRIRFARPYTAIADLDDLRAPRWFAGARLNIADSCFGAPPEAPAIIHQAEGGTLATMSGAELRALAGRVANGLCAAGYRAGDALAIYMPMTAEAVAIYLGIVFAGCTAVGIADSFAADEIRVRLRITGAKAIFTQDEMLRGGKALPLYAKVIEADTAAAIVLAGGGRPAAVSRADDLSWEEFLSAEEAFSPVACEPDAPTNILFSSGTTGEPKADSWTHSTPVKCAADGWLHQDIHAGDVVAWPTSLGWMMGPWLIYASLVNGAAMALFDGAPTGREFGEFVQRAGVTMLGVVPSLVRAWRRSGCMAGLDWRAIRAFSSRRAVQRRGLSVSDGARGLPPGDRVLWRHRDRRRLHYRHRDSTGRAHRVHYAVAGLDFLILDDDGRPAANGEVFLRPPSIGLSTSLLNQDHHAVYFDDAPAADGSVPLRRHGDQIEQLAGGGYRIHGRVDDTMNLGGIKVSSWRSNGCSIPCPGWRKRLPWPCNRRRADRAGW